MQTKLGSFYEVMINVGIGFILSYFLNLIVLPVFGHGTPSLLNNLGMTIVFTVVSVIRGYVIRRWFNERICRMAERLAA